MRSSMVVSLLALAACDVDIQAGEVQRCALGAHSLTLMQSESQIGRPFTVDRYFMGWNDQMPDDKGRASAAAGHRLLLSWHPVLASNVVLTWAQVASGTDMRVETPLAAAAASLRDFGEPVFLIFHDEANDDAAEGGSAGDFIAAYKHVVQTFRDAGATNVSWVWSLTSRAYPDDADNWYPGDEWVDWIGVTGYNWYTGDAVSQWHTFASIFASFVEWGRGHDKPLMIVSTASGENPKVAPDDETRSKAAWIRGAITSISETPQIQAFNWYDAGDTTDPYRDWRIDSSAVSLDAFRALASDPHFDVTAKTAP